MVKFKIDKDRNVNITPSGHWNSIGQRLQKKNGKKEELSCMYQELIGDLLCLPQNVHTNIAFSNTKLALLKCATHELTTMSVKCCLKELENINIHNNNKFGWNPSPTQLRCKITSIT